MDMLSGAVRNSRTASRNHSAPSAAARCTPPSCATKRSSRSAASSSSASAVCPSPSTGRGSARPVRRAASTAKLAKRTSRAAGGVPGGARMARWRRSATRSRKRAPRPAVHRRMLRGQTPWRAATAGAASPAATAPTAENTTSAPVTLPGSASHGSTRTRAWHVAQRASATWSCTNSPGRCSLRPMRTPVSASRVPPHRPQRHPSSTRPLSPALTTAS